MKKELLVIDKMGVLLLILLLVYVAINLQYFSRNNVLKAHIINTCTSKEAAIYQATKDIEIGKRYVLVSGLLDVEMAKKFEEKEKIYSCTYISLGCLGGTANNRIYDQIMRRAINEQAQRYVFHTFDKYTMERFKDKIK
jgi:hypothetical protein